MIKQPMSQKFLMATVIVTSFILTACGGSFEEIANNNLYAYKFANKIAVPETAQVGYKDITLTTNDGEQDLSIHGWYYYKSQSSPTVIYLHGNGANIGGLYQGGILGALKNLNANVVVIDYPAYGKSTGFPTKSSLTASAGKAITFARSKFKRSKIIIWGRSVGTGVASQVIKNYRSSISGFVLTSPWSTVEDLIDHHFSSLKDQVPKDWFEANDYNSVEALEYNKLPGLILHGDKDEIIPHKLGVKLYNSIRNKRQVEFITMDGYDHNDVFQSEEMWKDISQFVRSFR